MPNLRGRERKYGFLSYQLVLILGLVRVIIVLSGKFAEIGNAYGKVDRSFGIIRHSRALIKKPKKRLPRSPRAAPGDEVCF